MLILIQTIMIYDQSNNDGLYCNLDVFTEVYNLRDSQGKLFNPKPPTDYMKRSFSYSGAFLWNSLPESHICR